MWTSLGPDDGMAVKCQSSILASETVVHVRSDAWDAWGLTVQDLTLGCFFNLEALHFKVDLDSKSTQRGAMAPKRPSSSVVYEEHTLASTECDSWQVWWDFFTDSLLEAFSLSHTNHASRFHGELVITFVTPEELMGPPLNYQEVFEVVG
ncbi:hypothetical protein EV421DRAFT_1743556 [Armillaria borealis]|uniref:Uncharacterized protein n=1 Tax=Armillaria borealis TaxID=47425 RepID=A0AA39IWC2_9AGAR|nr:hypothetical protein EV421DRAFT_1743556 [Armillaria borealis]